MVRCRLFCVQFLFHPSFFLSLPLSTSHSHTCAPCRPLSVVFLLPRSHDVDGLQLLCAARLGLLRGSVRPDGGASGAGTPPTPLNPDSLADGHSMYTSLLRAHSHLTPRVQRGARKGLALAAGGTLDASLFDAGTEAVAVANAAMKRSPIPTARVVTPQKRVWRSELQRCAMWSTVASIVPCRLRVHAACVQSTSPWNSFISMCAPALLGFGASSATSSAAGAGHGSGSGGGHRYPTVWSSSGWQMSGAAGSATDAEAVYDAMFETSSEEEDKHAWGRDRIKRMLAHRNRAARDRNMRRLSWTSDVDRVSPRRDALEQLVKGKGKGKQSSPSADGDDVSDEWSVWSDSDATSITDDAHDSSSFVSLDADDESVEADADDQVPYASDEEVRAAACYVACPSIMQCGASL